MKVTISQYRALNEDAQGNDLSLGGAPVASELRTTDGNFTALGDETKFIRVATDTAIHLKWGAGATTSDPYIPAGSVEYFAASESTVLSILTA